MIRLIVSALLPLILFFRAGGQTLTPEDSGALVNRIQGELTGPLLPDSAVDPKVPQGEFIRGKITDSKIFPGTENEFEVYVPAQYDPAKPACLLVRFDGLNPYECTVLDNLIAKKEIPIMIAVGVGSGKIWEDPPDVPAPKRRAYRFNRSYEFDSMNDQLPDYVLNEVLPAVTTLKTANGRAINISSDGNDRAVTGASTGGKAAFTLAWERPDLFTRVYTVVGTFVAMRGAEEYPSLIRKTEPKPLRIFLEDGSADAWNALFGSWYEANTSMESALKFSGYDVAHAWGTHGHDVHPGMVIFPDVMRWLWRDYPKPIEPGVSQNRTLQQILIPTEGWHRIPQPFQSAAGLAANNKGDVYLSDATAGAVYRLGTDDTVTNFVEHSGGIVGQAFGPDGTLYGVVPAEKKIIALDSHGHSRTIAEGIAGRGIIAANAGTVFVSEPGEHPDLPGRIWRIKANGGKEVIDEGLSSPSGIAFSPDGSLFFAAENSTQWIYSFFIQSDGTFSAKERFYWLQTTDIPNNSGAEDIAVDARGYLYVATRMGIQVCDINGRVRSILPLPTPSGPVRSLCFGGANFDQLYATDGIRLFRRKLKIPGFAPWRAPIELPGEGGG